MSSELERSARLDAIGAVRCALGNDEHGLRHLVEQTDDPREAFHAASGFAASLLALMPADTRTKVLDELTRAAVAE